MSEGWEIMAGPYMILLLLLYDGAGNVFVVYEWLFGFGVGMANLSVCV